MFFFTGLDRRPHHHRPPPSRARRGRKRRSSRGKIWPPARAGRAATGAPSSRVCLVALAHSPRPTHRQLLSFFLPPPHHKLSAVISFLISASLLSLKSFHPQNFGASSILRIKGQSRDFYPCFFLSWFYPIWSAYFSASNFEVSYIGNLLFMH